MTASLAPVDTQTLAALRSGDEHALEVIFRERYPVLMPEAQEALADAASASRVVERAHLHLWNERATVDSAARVNDLLREGVHQGTVRERSRRAAAHRLVEHEGGHVRPAKAPSPPPSVDEAWQHLRTVLHPSTADAEHSRVRAERARHETAHHIADVEKPRSRVPVVIGVVLGALAVLALVFSLDSVAPTASLSRALGSPEARPYTSARGQRARVGLEGVDAFVLGAESRLVVPARFADLRGVGLEGTANVDVADGQRLILDTPGGRVMTNGGRLAVSARPGEEMMVRVDSGTALVTPLRGTEQEVLAGQTMVFAPGDTAGAAATRERADETLGWTGDSLLIAQRPLRDVIPQLARWYGLDLWVADSSLLGRPVTMRAGLGSSREAISALEQAASVRIQNTGGRLYVNDAGAPAPAAARRPRA
jgi:ferric-dicitrate binding protein FerR (iron transport regulator)